MNIKKIIAGVLACCAVGGVLPVSSISDTAGTAFAVDAAQVDPSLKYALQNSGAYYAITGFDNSVSSVEIPSEIDSIPVRVIADRAFENATKLESITISEGITDINNYAFSSCTSLKEIHLPSTLKYIQDSAFSKCISLEDIDIPDGVKTIGKYAFSNCTNLLTLEFPSSISAINSYVADGCRNLQSVVINNGPTNISDYAFGNCTKLKTVSIPTSITSTTFYSFLNCNALEDVYYAGNPDQFAIISSANYNFENSKVHYGEKAPTLYELAGRKLGDLNDDGLIDSNDASLILSYYAYTSTGGKDTLDKFLASFKD